MRELTVAVVKNIEGDFHNGERQLHGYRFEWPSGDPVTLGVDKFCQFGVRFLVGKERLHLDRLNIHLLAETVEDKEQPYQKGRFRRFMIRQDGILCLKDGTVTQVQFDTKDDIRVLEWLGWVGNDLWVDIGVRYDEVPSEEAA